MFLIIAGLWVWVFVPSWFKRSEDRQAEKTTTRKIRGEINGVKKSPSQGSISVIAEQNFRLSMTQRIFSTIAFFALAFAIASIFMSVSQTFYLIVTFIFSGIFAGSLLVARAAKRKSQSVLLRSSKSRSSIYAANASAYRGLDSNSLIAGTPVDTRSWEPSVLPAPRQRIGELQTPTLAEVVEIDERVIKKSQATLDSTALDEILRRRRANG